MSQIPAHIAADDERIVSANDEDLKRVQKLASEMVEVDTAISDLELALKSKKERKQQIEFRELPDLLGEFNMDRIGLPDKNVDIEVRPYCKANIASSWEEERKNAAFDWLVNNGHGDVIAVNVTVAFSRGEKDLADSLVQLIRSQFPGANSHPIRLEMGVPWNTLTSLVKSELAEGTAVPLDTLGATVGNVAKIVKRKK